MSRGVSLDPIINGAFSVGSDPRLADDNLNLGASPAVRRSHLAFGLRRKGSQIISALKPLTSRGVFP